MGTRSPPRQRSRLGGRKPNSGVRSYGHGENGWKQPARPARWKRSCDWTSLVARPVRQPLGRLISAIGSPAPPHGVRPARPGPRSQAGRPTGTQSSPWPGKWSIATADARAGVGAVGASRRSISGATRHRGRAIPYALRVHANRHRSRHNRRRNRVHCGRSRQHTTDKPR